MYKLSTVVRCVAWFLHLSLYHGFGLFASHSPSHLPSSFRSLSLSLPLFIHSSLSLPGITPLAKYTDAPSTYGKIRTVGFSGNLFQKWINGVRNVGPRAGGSTGRVPGSAAAVGGVVDRGWGRRMVVV